MDYDAFGRETKKYLPYPDAPNQGLFRANALAEQASKIASVGPTKTGTAYTEIEFEASPLSRVLRQKAPASSLWQSLNTRTNTNADAIKLFSYNFATQRIENSPIGGWGAGEL
jgi:hypothetical protein